MQPQLVTALAWPQHKGLLEGRAGTSTDMLLVGRIDGTIGLVEVLDHTTYHRTELEQCYRGEGKHYKLGHKDTDPGVFAC